MLQYFKLFLNPNRNHHLSELIVYLKVRCISINLLKFLNITEEDPISGKHIEFIIDIGWFSHFK